MLAGLGNRAARRLRHWAILVSLALVVAGGVARLHQQEKARQARFARLAAEIMPLGDFHNLRVDRSGSEAAFTRPMKRGLGLSILDLRTGNEKQLIHEGVRTFAYSPGGEFLLTAQGPEHPALFERRISRWRSLGGRRMVEGVWLSAHGVCALMKPPSAALLAIGPTNCAITNLSIPAKARWLTAVSEERAAFAEGATIQALDFKAGEQWVVADLTNLVVRGRDGISAPNRAAGEPMWLNYSRENAGFLFCSWDQSNWRHLFCYTPGRKSGELVQLTFDSEHSYNGQWIQNGNGVAFIANTNNHFYLAVRPSERTGYTNLFCSGHAYQFSVSGDGESVVAVASAGSEPPGIWEYAISERRLRYAGGRGPDFVLAEVIPRTERRARSFDGLEIPYYFLAPSRHVRGKRSPAIIAIPPFGVQFNQRWERFSQFFGNIGVFHIAVNHRGCDGYGKFFQERGFTEAYRDVLAVYEEIRHDPRIDPKRIYLMSFSGGSQIANDVIRANPRIWAGVMTACGAPPTKDVRVLRRLKFFLYVGDRDRLWAPVTEFAGWAKENGVRVQTMIGAGSGHNPADTDIQRDMAVALAEFIFDE